MINKETATPKERYDHLLKVMKSDKFLKKLGLNNEVPFFICEYAPKEEDHFFKLISQLERSLKTDGIQVLSIDIYDLTVKLLQKEDLWSRIVKQETSFDKKELKELLQGVLDPEKYLVPAIAQVMEERPFDILFLKGFGQVYPYLRTHNILENLQSTAQDKPTVIFFPGAYVHSVEKGASLSLFGLIDNDKYYRAFNIYNTTV